MIDKWRIRKGDRVVVITGKDKGKIGEINQVIRKNCKIIVQGVNLITKHQKTTATQTGGIIRKESPIHMSNVMIADPKDDKPSRIGMKILENGRKVRFAKKSGEIIDR